MNKIKKFVCCCFTCVEVSEQIVPHNTDSNLLKPLLETSVEKNYLDDEQLQQANWVSYTNKYYNPKKSLKQQRREKKMRKKQYSFYKNRKL